MKISFKWKSRILNPFPSTLVMMIMMMKLRFLRLAHFSNGSKTKISFVWMLYFFFFFFNWKELIRGRPIRNSRNSFGLSPCHSFSSEVKQPLLTFNPCMNINNTSLGCFSVYTGSWIYTENLWFLILFQTIRKPVMKISKVFGEASFSLTFTEFLILQTVGTLNLRAYFLRFRACVCLINL